MRGREASIWKSLSAKEASQGGQREEEIVCMSVCGGMEGVPVVMQAQTSDQESGWWTSLPLWNDTISLASKDPPMYSPVDLDCFKWNTNYGISKNGSKVALVFVSLHLMGPRATTHSKETNTPRTASGSHSYISISCLILLLTLK